MNIGKTQQVTYEQIEYKSISSYEAIHNLLCTNPELTEFVKSAIEQGVDRESILGALKNFTKQTKPVQLLVVSGAYFGDEAKGKTVMALVMHNEVHGCVRANSGANAGHTVVAKVNGIDKEFKFHIMPSSILSGKLSIIGDQVVMDPVSFLEEEVQPVLDDGFSLDNLKIGNCDIVCPWHKIADLAGDPNASTGQGMRQVHSAKALKLQVRLDDILNNIESIRTGAYKRLIKSYEEFIKPLLERFGSLQEIEKHIQASPKYNNLPNHIKQFLSLHTKEEQLKYVGEILIESVSKIKNSGYRADAKNLLKKELRKGRVFVVEGPQSFFLSNGNPIHPNSTTSAQTHMSGILGTLGADKYLGKALAINITKIPGSRVGSGANPAGYVPQDWFSDRKLTRENIPTINYDHAASLFLSRIDESTGLFIGNDEKYIDENGETVTINTPVGEEILTIREALACACGPEFDEFGATTKKPRVCGSLDLMHMKHVAEEQGELFSLSRVDGMDGQEKIPVVIGYKYNGVEIITDRETEYHPGQIITLDDGLPNEEVLKHCEPIYKVLPGWKTSKNIQTGQIIPTDLARFVRTIEDLTKTKLVSIGNGKKTEALIHLTTQKVKKVLNFSTLEEGFQPIMPGYLPSLRASGQIAKNEQEADRIYQKIKLIIEAHKSKILSLTEDQNKEKISSITALMTHVGDFVREHTVEIDTHFWEGRAESWLKELESRKAA